MDDPSINKNQVRERGRVRWGFIKKEMGNTNERVVVGGVWEGGCECTISTGEGGWGRYTIAKRG